MLNEQKERKQNTGGINILKRSNMSTPMSQISQLTDQSINWEEGSMSRGEDLWSWSQSTDQFNQLITEIHCEKSSLKEGSVDSTRSSEIK